MNTRIKLLCSFVVFLFIGSLVMTGVNAFIPQSTDSDQNVIAETYGDDRRNEAVNILIDTYLVDTAADGEWDHVLSSLKGSLEGKFTYDNLTDYTQLGSVIDEYDVLLIPENEQGSFATSNTIAAAWSSILPAFVENGGIVICMTYENTTMRGATAQILNATGLMKLYNPFSAFTHQVDLVDTDDALARNMASSYVAPSGSVNFDTTDGTVVMEDNLNGKAVVVHKTMGKGHVVLLGFDMYTVDANQDTLLMNSVLLHRHVVIDNSHNQYDTIASGLTTMADDLPYFGFSVSSMNTFSPSLLAASEILVLTYCLTDYNASEIASIQDFVNTGGALLIITEYGTFGNSLDPVMDSFGYERNASVLEDSDDFVTNTQWFNLQPENIVMHSTKVGVDVLEVYAPSSIMVMPSSAVPLVMTDTDGTASYVGGGEANGVAIGVAQTIGAGRLIILTDNGFVSDYDYDSDATINYYDSDNELFVRNAFRWLSGAGIPEQTVVFDQSHNPSFNIFSSWAPLAYFLMFNGYNVEYMSYFEPAAFADSDILVICDGSVGYNTTEISIIVEYVSGGGGLVLWGDNNDYGKQVEPIGLEFGLELNTTGYLDDTNDFDTYSSYVVYESSNFANHPIMDGVNRIEVDRSSGFISISVGVALIRGDNDNTSIYHDGTPAQNIPVFATALHNMGRVVFLTDINMGQIIDPEGDGFGNLYDSDNPVFVANVFKWLAENRAPTVEVISPNGGEILNGTITVEWDAVDFDSDPLTYEVWYTDNNGSDWSLLEDGLMTNTYDWNTTLHDDGTGYMIRVIASDAISIGQDDSDNPFELDNYVGGGGPPLDYTLFLIIAGAGIVIIVIIIIIMKKKK